MTDNVVIDLTGYKDRMGAHLPEGRYRVVVEDAEKDQSRAGNQMINIWFRVQGGDHDGSTVVDRLVLTEKSLFRVVGFMQGIGLPTPKKRLNLNLSNVIGKVLDIDIEDGEPYNGRVKSEVRGYVRVKREAAEEVDLDDAPAEEPKAKTNGSAPEPAPAAEGDEVDLDSLQL